MCEILLSDAGLMNGRDGIASADDGSGAGAGGGSDGSGDFKRAIRESRHFKDAHGAVPNDGLGPGNLSGEGGGSLWADIEPHLVGRRRSDVNSGSRSLGFEFWSNDVVDREKQLEISLLGVGKDFAGEFEFVVFDERFSDGQALGLEKSVGHTAADEHGVGDVHEIFDDFDFIAYLCSAEDRNERTGRIGEGLAKIIELFFHEQAGNGHFDKTGDTHHRSMGAMRGSKGIADKNAIAKRGQLLREGFVVLLFLGMEANIFEKQDIALSERLALGFGDGADAIRGESNMFIEKLFELFDDGERAKTWHRDRPWAGQDAKRE